MSDLEHVRRVSELKTLRNLRPCVDNDLMLRVEGRLENADLPTDTKRPLILPSRHPLIILDEHAKSWTCRSMLYANAYAAAFLDCVWNFER